MSNSDHEASSRSQPAKVPHADGERRHGSSLRRTSLVAAFFLAVSLPVYAPALSGPFVGDDHLLLGAAPLHEFGLDSLRAIFSPNSAVSVAYMNYSPVAALGHAAEIQTFGDRLAAYHIVNVVVHAVASALLAALYAQSGLPPVAALVGALLFLLHPANTEAVAWISQLKTSLCSVFAFWALLAQRRRPGLTAVLFALALLTKPHAAFALPVMAVREWTGLGREGGRTTAAGHRGYWVAVWTGVFVAFAIVGFGPFADHGLAAQPGFAQDPALQVRTAFALVARYLWMAVTTRGLSAYHEPNLATGLGDPWWLAGLVVSALACWRLVTLVRARRSEATWWIWVLAGFAPVSQILPLRYLVADRFLYFMLPGLIGVVLCVVCELRDRVPSGRRGLASRSIAVAGIFVALLFGMRSFERAAIWRSEKSVFADVAAHYPDGLHGHLTRARQSAALGDTAGAIAALRGAAMRGWTSVGSLYVGEDFENLRGDPEFRRFADTLTSNALRGLYARPTPSQFELSVAAQLHMFRGERALAIRAVERAIAMGGPETAQLHQLLATLRVEPELSAP